MGMPANNKTPIMGNCLSCQGLVRVPSTAPTTAVVKCPHCEKSFQLSDILNQAVPELQIVQDGRAQKEKEETEETAAKDAEGRFVVANQLRQSSKRSRRARRRSSSRSESTEGMVRIPKPVSEFDSSSRPVETPVSSARRTSDNERPRESYDSSRSSSSGSRSRESSSHDSSRSRSSSRRPSAKEPNPIFEILKVVLGGALAIPIAYLLFLWMFKQDPLQIAPSISKSAPFLVPAEFAEEPSAEGSQADGETEGEAANVEDVLDVSGGLPKPRLDPNDVGVN